MIEYWIAHMKNGQDLNFNKEAGYISTLDNTTIVTFMTDQFGNCIAAIPPENILWIEKVRED